jgi:uncharacterized membrane protein
MKRIHSIDIVRGLVMVIMALDHTRDLIHTTAIAQQPTNLATTTPILFFTRWITHLCAPTFVFLSGASAFLSFYQKSNIKASRSFLLTRGLWLVVLDLTILNFAIFFDVHFSMTVFDVLSTIGIGFIVLSFMMKMSPKTIGIIGLAIIFLHNLAPLAPFAETSLIKRILMPLFSPEVFPLAGGRIFVVGYPPLPWLGIMLTGFATGRIFLQTVAERKKIFLKIGVAAIVLFLLLRIINVYGDTAWAAQKNGVYSVLSFLNLTKYPPSLLFSLMFLGIMFLLLSEFDGRDNRFTRVLTVYGKVPLFYFIVHFYLIHLLLFVILFGQGYGPADFVFGSNFGRPKTGGGVSLPWVYLIWICVVIALHPLCKWYGQYRSTHPQKKWLRYL